MRRYSPVTALAVAAVLAPPVAGSTALPSVRLVDRTPVTVVGRGFQPHEIVRVRFTSQGRTLTRRTTALATGTFRARYGVSLGRCSSFSLRAFGSEGTHARFFSTAAQPDCNPNG
jgi:hypothetical protein